MMADDEVRVSLATRIPKTLSRQLKLYCAERDMLLMDFLVIAVRERLTSCGRGHRRRATAADSPRLAHAGRVRHSTAPPRRK
jgi:hypothetical protein